MASLPTSLLTSAALSQTVGAFTPLASVSSVVQTLSNIQGFNAGAFSSLSGSIGSALSGISELSNLVSNFSGTSALGAFSSALGLTGLAGSTIEQLAGDAASAFLKVDSFLSSVPMASNFASLLSIRTDVEGARSSRNAGGVYQFPADVGKYWIALSFMSYNYSASKTPVTTPGSSIILPVPDNLTDTNHLEYSRFSMSEAAGAVIGDVTGAVGSMAGGGGGMGAGAAFVAKALATSAEAAGVMGGVAINTNQSLKFVQPSLKTHQFTWKLVPSTQQEAESIRKIINAIKNHIYPKADMLAFKYPDLIRVYLCNASTMYLFKPAFVESFSVDYTPDGGPAFYKSQHPVAVRITMSIKENSVWTAEEFAGGTYASGYSVGQALKDVGAGVADTIAGVFR